MTEATEHDVTEPVPELDRFSVPHHWAAIDEAVTSAGGAVVEGLLGVRMLDALNDEIDAYLAEHVGAGNSATGSDGYDLFLGHRTIRLHGLIEKLASGADLIGMPELVGWANRHVAGGGCARQRVVRQQIEYTALAAVVLRRGHALLGNAQRTQGLQVLLWRLLADVVEGGAHLGGPRALHGRVLRLLGRGWQALGGHAHKARQGVARLGVQAPVI